MLINVNVFFSLSDQKITYLNKCQNTNQTLDIYICFIKTIATGTHYAYCLLMRVHSLHMVSNKSNKITFIGLVSSKNYNIGDPD